LDVSSYDLFIDLDFQGLKFKGILVVTLKTDRDIVLNSVGLSIDRIRRNDVNCQFSLKDENLIVRTGAFEGSVKVEYAGRVPNSLAGIYRAPYDGTHLVTTHFEAAQARRMFPCVDQPDMKAEFKLSVRVDGDLQAISNMPIESERRDGDKKIVTFQTTPRMSTYLLYLGVGKFQVRSSKVGETEIILELRLARCIEAHLQKRRPRKLSSSSTDTTRYPTPFQKSILWRFLSFRWAPWKTGVQSHFGKSSSWSIRIRV